MSTAFDEKLHWYKDAIIYELHLKAFCDKNGDGVGDIEGLISKLDYLQDLGVTAIWILPFFPSPLRDDGYDIADYYSINPLYGNTELFRELMEEAHKRKLKVIVELVINHTSDQHPWFIKARNAPKGSKERDYYVWSDDPNKYKDVRIIFQDYEMSNWTYDAVAQQYYWHRFFHHQPDLNFDNPEVQQEVFNVLDFWCNMGVDGFRLDAVPYLFERDETNCENLPETHAFLKKLRKHVDMHYPGTLLLAEANMWPEDSAAYFGNGDECHMNYHFPIMPRMFMSIQMEDRYPITDIFNQTPDIPETCQWAIFLRNHDELTLEMVTDEERDYMYKVYVTDPKARINLGIRQRLAPLMQNNRRKIELINSLLFSLPGTPVIYYGDEIGMGDNFYLGDRDGVRTPMQWTGNRNGGFSEANPQKLYLPLILSPEYHYEMVNVELQAANTSSLLWFMKRMIALRKKHKAFGRGNLKFHDAGNPKVLAFTRTHENETILVVVNLSRFSQPAELDLTGYKGYQPQELMSRNKFPIIKDERYFLSLDSYGFQWYALQQQDAAVSTRQTMTYEAATFQQLFEGGYKDELLNNVLPEWLKSKRWFGGKSREIQGIEAEDMQLLERGHASPVMWTLIKVHYYHGLPEIYQLPVIFLPDTGAASKELSGNYPQSLITKVTIDGKEGGLYDALYDTETHQYLFRKLHLAEASTSGNKVTFESNERFRDLIGDTSSIKSKLFNAEQSNTSIIYDDSFYLKIYRKVDYDINPDEEMTRLLSEELSFAYVPDFYGSIEWASGKGNITLGMVQQLVENNGDAWQYMLDKVAVYNEDILAMPASELPSKEPSGTLINPCKFEDLPENLKQLLDATVAEKVRLLGVRTAEMHLKLASAITIPAFQPEPYSLHYQRSVYASFNTSIRESFDNLEKNKGNLAPKVQALAAEALSLRSSILESMKHLYDHKMDLLKIRIHGDYHLGQVLFTGKDLVILDFEGEPAKRYSERRLKFSALRDVAGIIRSFNYAAYGSLFLEGSARQEDIEALEPYAALWSHYMSGFFMAAYLETVKGSLLVPENKDDLKILMDVFLLSKVFYELNYELNNRPEWLIIPIKGILNIHSNNNPPHECNESKAATEGQ